MRRFLLIIIFSSLVNICQSQVLVKTGRTFRNYESYNGGFETHFYKIGGDSVSNGKTFKILFSSFDSLFSNKYVAALIREDSSKVYFTDPNNNNHLLYNFNLTKHDTFIGYSSHGQIKLVVDSVDYVVLDNGVVKKRLIFAGTQPNHDEWIEEVGSKYGLLSADLAEYSGDYREVLCVFDLDTLIFHNKKFNFCYNNTVGIEDQKLQNAFLIYPNPFHSQLFIKNNQISSVIFTIYNPMGSLITRKAIIPGESIDNIDLPIGVYFYNIEYKTEIIQRGKLEKVE